MAALVFRHAGNELMSLLLASAGDAAGLSRGMRLVNDHKLRAMCQEERSVSPALHEVYADHKVAVVLVYADIAPRQVAFQAGESVRAHNHSADLELRC